MPGSIEEEEDSPPSVQLQHDSSTFGGPKMEDITPIRSHQMISRQRSFEGGSNRNNNSFFTRKMSLSDSKPIRTGSLGQPDHGSIDEADIKRFTPNDVCVNINDDFNDEEHLRDSKPRDKFDPNFEILDEWAVEQLQSKSKNRGSSAQGRETRHQILSEPVLINGRYRSKGLWFPCDSKLEKQFRFTFFSDELSNTIHSPTLYEVTREDQSFRDLFSSGSVWWLNIQDPTEEEMEIIGQAFKVHPLTVEDIVTREEREKVELFRNYYLLSFHSLYRQTSDILYLEPLTMYIVVFREGVLTFHFGETNHCANVRRRIRQLHDYIAISPDWISYAIIDDITDSFQPIIASIEKEVDEIDEIVLGFPDDDTTNDIKNFQNTKQEQSHMLRRLGECRKRVTSMLRLLSSKADVVRGFSKRCNEHWEVAPKSEIGLYLGDIQDHILTMVANLNHYEKILSRSHSNYLADMSIEMTRINNDTNNVVSRLTVLGTIIFPMNLITGLWGMNVKVPGQFQDEDGLNWFYSICFCLLIFAIISVGFCRYLRVV